MMRTGGVSLDMDYLLPLAWIDIAICVLIFLHSAYINRRKYPIIRILVEVSAFGTGLQGLLLVLSTYYRTPHQHALFVNVGVCLFGYTLARTSDVIVFFMGYQLVTKNISMHTWFHLINATFILRYSTWFFGNSVVPFIINENSSIFYRYMYTSAVSIVLTSGVCFNIFFTYKFIIILYKANIQKSIRIPKTAQVFAIKCVLHFLASTIPSLNAVVEPMPQTTLIVSLFISLGLHVLFNSKIDELFKSRAMQGALVRQIKWLEKRFVTRTNATVRPIAEQEYSQVL